MMISTTICVTSWLYASGSCVNSIWFKWCTSSVIIFTFDKALPDPKRLFSAEVLGMPGICSASRSSEVCRESIETWQRVVPVVGGCPESELRSTWASGHRPPPAAMFTSIPNYWGCARSSDLSAQVLRNPRPEFLLLALQNLDCVSVSIGRVENLG